MCACRPLPEKSEPSIVDLLVDLVAGVLQTKGRVPEDQAIETARRSVRQLLALPGVGGRKWYLPNSGDTAEARRMRNESVRESARQRVPKETIMRVFGISLPLYYKILRNK